METLIFDRIRSGNWTIEIEPRRAIKLETARRFAWVVSHANGLWYACEDNCIYVIWHDGAQLMIGTQGGSQLDAFEAFVLGQGIYAQPAAADSAPLPGKASSMDELLGRIGDLVHLRIDDVTVTVERRADDWMAYINDDKKRFSAGSSVDSAIGGAIRAHADFITTKPSGSGEPHDDVIAPPMPPPSRSAWGHIILAFHCVGVQIEEQKARIVTLEAERDTLKSRNEEVYAYWKDTERQLHENAQHYHDEKRSLQQNRENKEKWWDELVMKVAVALGFESTADVFNFGVGRIEQWKARIAALEAGRAEAVKLLHDVDSCGPYDLNAFAQENEGLHDFPGVLERVREYIENSKA